MPAYLRDAEQFLTAPRRFARLQAGIVCPPLPGRAAMNPATIRKPAVAGMFYPQEPARLRDTVRQYIEESHVEPAPDQVVAIVVPHAGYIYSGPTAGFAYARIRGKRPRGQIYDDPGRYWVHSAELAV